jgi:hypothetical protein
VAQKTIVQLIDDLDGGEADEIVEFGLDGVTYTIDLSSANAKRLRDGLADFLPVARRSGGRKQRKATGTAPVKATDKAEAQRIRDWARGEGHKVSDRGRIPQNLVIQFQEAHAS